MFPKTILGSTIHMKALTREFGYHRIKAITKEALHKDFINKGKNLFGENL